MDFKDKIRTLSDRILQNINKTNTEEATKTAFILPLIQFLGYDIFNPSEVVPEFTADYGVKKGEKVDYAIIINEEPLILVEAKHHTEKLNIHGSQLFRYFTVTKSKFGILTNGVEYEFYTDLEKPNLMDTKPFFKFNICEIKESEINELKKFQKEKFNLSEIVSSASDLKYSSEVYNVIQREIDNPSDDFIKYFLQNCYEGRATSKVIEQFRDIIQKTFHQYVNNTISNKLSLNIDIPETKKEETIQIAESEKIQTTFEEIESYSIIKSILHDVVDPKRIYYRDNLNYFTVLLDDNNRKTICRLYLNGNKKSICFLDGEKKETKTQISSINDIFQYKEQILESIGKYEKQITQSIL